MQDGERAVTRLGASRDSRLWMRVHESIAAVTHEQVNAALRRDLKPADFVTAVAGDFKD